MDQERAPSLIAVLDAVDSGWRRQAACRDEPDDRLFLSDKALHSQPGSPTILLALLICAGCPVRRECLLEAMTPIVSHPPRWDPKTERLQENGVGSTRIMLSGVWGGTLEAERSPLWNVPIPEAVEQLERTFPVRLARFAQAFARSRAQRKARPADRPGPRHCSQSLRSQGS